MAVDGQGQPASGGPDYFETIWPVELEAVNKRRDSIGRRPVEPLQPPGSAETRIRSPDPARAFAGPGARAQHRAAPPEHVRMRPEPVPCDATGLALSGGGIRSAALCLGALQALSVHKRLATLDYLSTVSGGGYIGGCLSAAMSTKGEARFPFGDAVKDSPAVAHLRNYSNYLLPRGRSTQRNLGEAAAILLRGLLANTVIVGSFVLMAAMLTWLAGWLKLDSPIGWTTVGVAAAAALLLLVSAIGRSGGAWLHLSYPPLVVACALALVVAQLALAGATPGVEKWFCHLLRERSWSAGGLAAALTTLSGAISVFAGRIGVFLTTTQRSDRLGVIARRLLMQGLVLLASCVVPVLLWGAVLLLADRLATAQCMVLFGVTLPAPLPLYIGLWLAGTLISLVLRANSFSLHRFYRDRLGAAFVFKPGPTPKPLDSCQLSDLKGGAGPYHIINAALNVQGSREANRRGRGADFFSFTPDFVGSDLTGYQDARRYGIARAQGGLDPALDLATALAISGAAVSANMGSGTIRTLSPTLALLNVRLGYWLPNPRPAAKASLGAKRRLHKLVQRFKDKLYLPMEMFNMLDEEEPAIYLTDGGHIENLGIYELLKRGCKAIIAIDAEADPAIAVPSLLKLERYARIDFGIRIVLPWEEIARMHRKMEARMGETHPLRERGPHCAIGRILYADGQQGVLLYVKASMTGDEKDYLLDYKKRYPAFPHENTGDQFFSEEQFEAYRALGFHMVDGFFGRTDRFAFLRDDFGTAQDAFDELDRSVYRHP